MEYKNKEEFLEYFHQSVINDSSIEDEEKTLELSFTEQIIDHLVEINVISDVELAHYKGRGVKIDAFSYNTTDDTVPSNTIELFVSHFKEDYKGIKNVPEVEIQAYLKRIKNFFVKSRTGAAYEYIDESAEVHDLSKVIQQNFNNIRIAKIIFLTNGKIKAREGSTEVLSGNCSIEYHFWDLERLWKILSSGVKKELITIDFKSNEIGLNPIECLHKKDKYNVYTTYIALLDGEILRDLYDKYGTRLLERNVRAFLQQKNKVNSGLRRTISDDQNMFLAYNNGITVTALEVVIENIKGKSYINKIKDFQIVNGGQTVASLWHTAVKNRIKIDKATVQMKLTVVNNENKIDEISKNISRYSNAQNAVNQADFTSNSPFHRLMEELSRSIWSPDPTGGNKMTRWFYERSRGSYTEAYNLERTSARKKQWQLIYPKHQKFDKILFAVISNTWMRQPWIVSQGAQKNYNNYMGFIEKHAKDETDGYTWLNGNYYKKIVTMLIVWKTTEKIIGKQPFTGYRRNIVTYTLSLLLEHNENIFPLENIYNQQSLSDDIIEIIDFHGYKVREILIKEANRLTLNVTEYAKKELCWDKIIKSIKVKTEIDNFNYSHQEISNVEDVFELKYEYFTEKHIIFWDNVIKNTNSSRDKDFFNSIITLIKNKKNPSEKQFAFAKRLLKKFDNNELSSFN